MLMRPMLKISISLTECIIYCIVWYNSYMRVSDYFSLKTTQPSLDFVDVDLEKDVKLFVDPSALYLLNTEWGSKCRSLIKSFFSTVLESTKNGDDDRTRELLAQLSEPNETHLGLSRNKSQGRGMGTSLADRVWQSLKHSDAVKTGIITDLEDTALLIDGIASDIISDVVTNIIREPLLEYTMKISKEYSIPLEEHSTLQLWDPAKKEWTYKDMPQIIISTHNKIKRLTLVPKSIVRKSISYNAGKYYNKYLLEELQDEEAAKGLVRILKNGESRPIPKKEIKKSHISNGGKIHEKEQNRKLTPSRLDVLYRYKEETNNNPAPVLSHGEIADGTGNPIPNWDALLNELLAIKPGNREAKKYEKVVQNLLTALFYPWLAYPEPQTKMHNGRKIIDITFTNIAQEDFFKWVKDHYPAPYIFVECKNYNTDIENPELDQMAGRFSPSRGRIGIIICRKIENRKKIEASCRDTANDDRGYIIVLDDEDIKNLVRDIKTKGSEHKLDILRDRFKKLVF